MRNAFTVDFEDWYQGIELPFSTWNEYEVRIEKGLEVILDLLSKHQVKATFFTLGWVGEKYPHLIKKVVALGHELGSHSYTHEKVYDQTPEEFRKEIKETKEVLEQVSGTAVVSHRSPFFSITNRSLWGLQLLQEEGYTIDCSISPIKTWSYGISTCPDEIFRFKEFNLIEFPVSKFQYFKKSWAVGGAYFRLLPYSFTSNGIKKRIKKGKYNMFYIHPWEYDANHPVAPLEWKAKLTHYTNLKKTTPNTDKLLNEFEWDTVSSVIKHYEQEHGKLNTYSVELFKD